MKAPEMANTTERAVLTIRATKFAKSVAGPLVVVKARLCSAMKLLRYINLARIRMAL